MLTAAEVQAQDRELKRMHMKLNELREAVADFSSPDIPPVKVIGWVTDVDSVTNPRRTPIYGIGA